MINIETCLDKSGKYKKTKKHHKLFFDQINEGNIEFIKSALDVSPEMVNILGENNNWYRDKSPLMYALQCTKAEMCILLIDRGADVNFRMPAGHKTTVCNWAATQATMYGEDNQEFIPILKKILELGANPNNSDYMGRDAIHEAISQLNASGEEHNWQTIKILIEAGADPKRKHKDWLLQLVKIFRKKRYDEPATPSLLAPEIYEIYGISKEELNSAIEAGK